MQPGGPGGPGHVERSGWSGLQTVQTSFRINWIGIQWKSWIQLVFWKCVVIICYLCWPPWHFCVQKSGFPIKEYQQEHKNNAVRRNMNIYMNIYPAIWQVVIFFSCWPPVAVSPSDGCSTIVWLGVPKVYQRSQVTKKWGFPGSPTFFSTGYKAGLNTCSCLFSTWCSIQSLNPVKSTMWLLNLNMCFDLFQFVYTFPKSTGSVLDSQKR